MKHLSSLFLPLTFFVFLALKVTETVDWSWWIVCSPLIVWASISALVMALAVAVVGIAGAGIITTLFVGSRR